MRFHINKMVIARIVPDTSHQMFDVLAHSGELLNGMLASSRKWAQRGPAISWHACSGGRKGTVSTPPTPAPLAIPEIEDAQAAEQAKQWDSDLQTQLQRAGYLATRLVRWHAPPSPAVPTIPPMQLPTPPNTAAIDWPAEWADNALLQQAALDADEVFAEDSRPSLEATPRTLPAPVKRMLRAGVHMLRWHITLCYWTAIGALGASIVAALVFTACRVLPMPDEQAVSGISWRRMPSSSSVLASMPDAALQVWWSHAASSLSSIWAHNRYQPRCHVVCRPPSQPLATTPGCDPTSWCPVQASRVLAWCIAGCATV